MNRIVFSAVLLSWFAAALSFAASPAQPPLRVGIVGLVHGQVHGFLGQSLHSPEIEIVGVAEPDADLLSQAATRYGFDRALLFTDLEDMIATAHPQAVLVYGCYHPEDLGIELSSVPLPVVLTCIETKRATSTAK
jgi:hypothetical protein